MLTIAEAASQKFVITKIFGTVSKALLLILMDTFDREFIRGQIPYTFK